GIALHKGQLFRQTLRTAALLPTLRVWRVNALRSRLRRHAEQRRVLRPQRGWARGVRQVPVRRQRQPGGPRRRGLRRWPTHLAGKPADGRKLSLAFCASARARARNCGALWIAEYV